VDVNLVCEKVVKTNEKWGVGRVRVCFPQWNIHQCNTETIVCRFAI